MGFASLATMYAAENQHRRVAHRGRVTHSVQGATVPPRAGLARAVVAWVLLMALVATVAVVTGG